MVNDANNFTIFQLQFKFKSLVSLKRGSTTGQMENEPEFLQQSLLTVVSLQQYCSQDFPLFDTAQMLCAIDPNPARSGNACTGDSGSPLVYLNHKRNDTFYLYGLTSFVLYDSVSPNAACDPTKPSYYVKVPSFLNWITKTILKMEKIPS
jgi:secreted trypsin-like serine protease